MKGLMFKALFPAFLFATLTALYGCDKAASSSGNTAQAAPVAQAIPAAQAAPASAAAVQQTDRVVVYYFHGDRRCRTCLGIQATIEQAIKERFVAEAASGKLVYKEVNIDQEANKPFVQQFQLSFSTMVVATMKGDKTLQWEDCKKVWDYGHEPLQLMDYTAERIKSQLTKLKGN